MTQIMQSRSHLRAEPDRRSGRIRLVWLALAGVAVVYYALSLVSVRSESAGAVAFDDSALSASVDPLVLQVEALALDTNAGTFEFTFRPLAEGAYRAPEGSGLAGPLKVEVSSADRPSEIFDFPAEQLVDPAVVTVGASRGATWFPFDRPHTDFAIAATSGGEPIPLSVRINDQTENWDLRGDARTSGNRLAVDLQARRDTLAISFAIFYIVGVLVVGLITISVIGASVLRGRAEFGKVIWLGAMLVAIPSVRGQMPGVPPIGTAADRFVFFPAIVIVGLCLVGAVFVLARNEAAAQLEGEVTAEDDDDY